MVELSFELTDQISPEKLLDVDSFLAFLTPTWPPPIGFGLLATFDRRPMHDSYPTTICQKSCLRDHGAV